MEYFSHRAAKGACFVHSFLTKEVMVLNARLDLNGINGWRFVGVALYRVVSLSELLFWFCGLSFCDSFLLVPLNPNCAAYSVHLSVKYLSTVWPVDRRALNYQPTIWGNNQIWQCCIISISSFTVPLAYNTQYNLLCMVITVLVVCRDVGGCCSTLPSPIEIGSWGENSRVERIFWREINNTFACLPLAYIYLRWVNMTQGCGPMES